MAKMRVGIYPGTFDPITNGHTDIILRATRLVDKLVVGVARNAGKGPIFSTEERVAIVREEIAVLDNGAHDRNEFISSRFVKEIGQLGGDVSHFVSPRVAEHLLHKFGDARKVAEAFERKIAAKNG